MEIFAFSFGQAEAQEYLWKGSKRQRAFLLTNRSWYLRMLEPLTEVTEIDVGISWDEDGIQ
jgi:hypothetical protein